MHRRLRETPPSGGPSSCAVSIFENDLKSAGIKLLDHLQWHGVAMAEFKRDAKSSQLYLLEINPKFWGSLDLALDSGVDFPALAARVALGGRSATANRIKSARSSIGHCKGNCSTCFRPRARSARAWPTCST
jgi:predicted ATP-grasp superfamily ATP-dependent carboligase